MLNCVTNTNTNGITTIVDRAVKGTKQRKIKNDALSTRLYGTQKASYRRRIVNMLYGGSKERLKLD